MWREENRRTRKKNPSVQGENQQQTQPTYDTGIEPETHWWEASDLTTAPSLLLSSYSSHLTYDAHTVYSHMSKTIGISWGNALRRALILYKVSNFLFTCQEFSVVSAVENNTYHNFVILGQKLRVERTRNVKLLGYLPGGLFDLKVKQLEIVLETTQGTPNHPIHKL